MLVRPRRRRARIFRDWRLDCGASGCAVRAGLRGGDGSHVLALEAAGVGEAAVLRLSTPLPLFLPDGLTLALGEAPLRAVEWRTCATAWCDAVAPLEADLLAGLKRERAAEVVLTLVDGVRIRLTISLLGFSAAWAALADEWRR